MSVFPNTFVPGVAKTASYTLKATDHNKRFTNDQAGGAIVFTLPALADIFDGWSAEFFISTGQTVTITAPSGKLVAGNNNAATSIAFSTASEKIGNYVKIVYDSTVAKYLAIVGLAHETMTPTIS